VKMAFAVLFGSFSLSDPAGRAIILSSRRARALIAYLAISVGQTATRERLCDLFWPDRAEAQARSSLRQCLLEIRKLLEPAGVDLLQADRDRISMRHGALDTDLARIDRAARAGNATELAALITAIGKAELLEDVELPGQFHDWLIQSRSTVERTMASHVHALLEALAAGGDTGSVISLAQAWLQRDPLDEDATAAAIRCDIAAGSPASAQRRFNRLKVLLADELNVAPSASVIDALNSANRGQPAQTEAGAIADLSNGGTTPPAKAYPRPSIAVMPFNNLGNDPDQAYFADGLMEEIVSSLTRIRTLLVIASGSTLSLKDHQLSATEAAAKLGVRYVLEGSVRRAGELIRISVRLIDASTGGQIWQDRFDGRNEDIFELQDSVAANVAGVIEFSVQTAEAIRAAKRPTSDLQSYDLYLRALGPFRTYTREGMFEALDLLNKALERDPDFGLALSLVACVHGNILQYGWGDDPALHEQLAIDLNQRAIRHGADDPQVLATSALALWNNAEIPAALSLAERAYQLNPGSSFTLMVRALISVAAGNLEDADDSVERSLRLDPLSPNRNLQLDIFAALRLAQGRFEEAADYARDAVQIDASPLGHGLLVAAQAKLGDEDAVKRELARFHALSTMTLEQVAARFYAKPEHRAMFMDRLADADADFRQTLAAGAS
jgi:TolB-like protein/DNA-binding SARP family transcriptional activator